MQHPRVDPRIAARRAEIARAALARRRRWLKALAAVLVVVVAVMGLARSPILAVQELDVEAGERVPAEKVVAASGLRTDVAMISVDAPQAAASIAELPWVKSATVSRRWPGTLSVEITERQAVAQLPGPDGTWFVVDRTGRLLDQYDAAVPGLVRLDAGMVAGPVGASLGDEWTDALRAADRIPPSMQDQLVLLGGEGAGLAAGLAQGGIVKLCGTADLDKKVLAVNTVLANVDPATVEVIDVCAPTAPVLTPRPAPV